MIRVGDVVAVIDGCPKCRVPMGLIFTVGLMREPRSKGYQCAKCNEQIYTTELGVSDGSAEWLIPISWVKKIADPYVPVREIIEAEA